MECPTCHQTNLVEIDTHADGFAANLHECGHCGSVWTAEGESVRLLHGATRSLQGSAETDECPICHSTSQVEIDIHADGFANNLEECGVCGALWTQGKDFTRLVHGATWAL